MGAAHGAVLDDRGGLWVWGDAAGPLPKRLPCRSPLESLASSQQNLYAITRSGGVLEWREIDKQLAESRSPPSEPRPMGGALSRVAAASMAAGDAHIVIVGRGGEVIVQGDNSQGQLGVGEPEATPRCEQPTLLKQLPGKATQAACGSAHSVVVLSDGRCVSFGDDRNMQLGLRQCTIKELKTGATRVCVPTEVRLLRDVNVVGAACGGGGIEGGHTVFHTRSDEGDALWSCGYGRWGQLGGKAYTHIADPKPINALSRLREWDESKQRVVSIPVVQVACGERHTAALLATGNVFVWGWNDQGQLGSGGSQGSHTPALVRSPPELRFSKLRGLTCGPNSTAAWT